jgi:D-3-phosphoglycerate dehydrogenase
VAQRCLAFGMRLIAYDPFVSEEAARRINVELVTLDELVARADFVTLHLAKTPETIGLIGAELLAKAKPGIRIVNVARGGIVDEQALADAIISGHVGGAALDVFDEEPKLDSPVFALDQVVVTPHLGASTVEAQDKAGDTIADMVILALAGDFVPFAVNVSAGEVSETVRPYQALAEKLGAMYAGLAGSAPSVLEITYAGDIAEYDTRILTLSLLKGFFGASSATPVSYVNAPKLAEEAGIEVRPTSTTTARDYVNLITVRGGGHSVAGTLHGLTGAPRLVMIDDYHSEITPAAHMIVVRNEDVPGMIGKIGSTVGAASVNICDMVVGQDADGIAALMVMSVDETPGDDVIASIGDLGGVKSVTRIEL